MTRYGTMPDYLTGRMVTSVSFNGFDVIDYQGGSVELIEEGLALYNRDSALLALVTNNDMIVIDKNVLNTSIVRYSSHETRLLDAFLNELFGFRCIYTRRYKRNRMYVYQFRPYYVDWSKDGEVKRYVENPTDMNPVIVLDILGNALAGIDKQRVITPSGKKRVPKNSLW